MLACSVRCGDGMPASLLMPEAGEEETRPVLDGAGGGGTNVVSGATVVQDSGAPPFRTFHAQAPSRIRDHHLTPELA